MKIVALTGNYGSCHDHGSPLRVIADSALLKDGKPFFLPDFAPEFQARPSLALRIDRLGKNVAPRFARRYYAFAAAALNIEAPALPGCEAWSFDGAAVTGPFLPLESFGSVPSFTVHAGKDIFTWDASRLCRNIDEVVAAVSRFFTVKTGDIILAGLSDDRIPLGIGMELCAAYGDLRLLNLKIK